MAKPRFKLGDSSATGPPPVYDQATESDACAWREPTATSLPYTSTGNLEEGWTRITSNIVIFNKEALRSFRDVYRAQRKLESGKIENIVVKIVKNTTIYSAKEVGILRKLADHQNIVKILEYGECEEVIPQIYIAMEQLPQDLDEYIYEKAFCLATATSFFRQIVSAINYMHNKNIVHRDLKPASILITAAGKSIKLTNFEISVEIPTDRTGVSVPFPEAGTDGFKAPETYLREPLITCKVDIYALGLNGYIIFSHGQHPFGVETHRVAENIVENVNRNLSNIPSFPGRCSQKRLELIDLFELLLQPGAYDRPSSSEVLQHEFFKDLDDDFYGICHTDEHGLRMDASDRNPQKTSFSETEQASGKNEASVLQPACVRGVQSFHCLSEAVDNIKLKVALFSKMSGVFVCRMWTYGDDDERDEWDKWEQIVKIYVNERDLFDKVTISPHKLIVEGSDSIMIELRKPDHQSNLEGAKQFYIDGEPSKQICVADVKKTGYLEEYFLIHPATKKLPQEYVFLRFHIQASNYATKVIPFQIKCGDEAIIHRERQALRSQMRDKSTHVSVVSDSAINTLAAGTSNVNSTKQDCTDSTTKS